MARVVGRAKIREGTGSSTKLSETAIFIAMGIMIILGLRWYFVVYKKSPGVALGEYIGGIKSGNLERQYAMLDASDKKLVPTEKDYEKACPQARGYAERIIEATMTQPVPDPKDPTYCKLDATISVRGPAGKNLTDNGQITQITTKFTMHKNSEGDWKVVLTKSDLHALTDLPASPPGDSWN